MYSRAESTVRLTHDGLRLRLCYRVRVLGQRNVRSKRVSLATHENQTKVAKRDEAMEREGQSGEPICEQLSPRKRPLSRILFGSEVSARQRTCGTSDHGASAAAAVYCDTACATHERREGYAVKERNSARAPAPQLCAPRLPIALVHENHRVVS